MHADDPTICLQIYDKSNTVSSSSPISLEFLDNVTRIEILGLFGYSREDSQLCVENGEALSLDDSLKFQCVKDKDILTSITLIERNTVVKRIPKISQKWVILNDMDRKSKVRYEFDKSKMVRDYLSDYWIVVVMLTLY